MSIAYFIIHVQVVLWINVNKKCWQKLEKNLIDVKKWLSDIVLSYSRNSERVKLMEL